MRKLLILSVVLILGSIMLHGCASETSAPTAPTVAKGTINPVADGFMATIGDATSSYYYVYTPPNYDASLAGGYPVLYLLHGFGGNENYFVALFSATDAADWLLSRGEIEPMIMVFPSAHNVLGGSFYTDGGHPTVGASETHIMNIITEVEANFNIDGTKRGIGGHSMGGYGAVSIAMNHPGMFGTLSALAAPLSFWGTQTFGDPTFKGLEELKDSVMAETGYDAILAQDPAGDYNAYHQMFYPSPDRRLSSFLFAAAAAFSPTNPLAPELTTIDSIVVGLDGNGNPIKSPMYVDLPFGIDGELYTPTWDRWREFDPVKRLMDGQAVNLVGVKIYLDAGSADDLGFYGSHDVFAGVLAQAGMVPDAHTTYAPIQDAAGNDIEADHTRYTYERLKGMLKWHSAQF